MIKALHIFTLNLVQMGPWAEAWVFEEKRETTKSGFPKGEFSPLEHSFVHHSRISDDFQSKALGLTCPTLCPRESCTSASRSNKMICSGLCRFRLILVYYGRDQEILTRREQIKKKTSCYEENKIAL